MITSNKKKVFIPAVMVLFGMLSCNHYNPFSDANNANTEIVSASFEAGDTIPIFSTQRLSMRVLVKELVTDIQVISAGNRLWASSDTALVSTQFSAETFTLDFSWADTGMQTITIITKTQQDEKLQELSLHTCSPLQQDSIRGHRGEYRYIESAQALRNCRAFACTAALDRSIAAELHLPVALSLLAISCTLGALRMNGDIE
ncbi:MAG: hypothetical protein ACOC0D_09795 [Spirochaeta sp.]